MSPRRRFAAGLLAALAAAAPLLTLAAAGDDPAGPRDSELRWRYNARQRTAAGLAAWQRGDAEAAAEVLEQALAVAPRPAEPRVLLNAGTGRLGAGKAEEALPLLTAAADAAEESGSELAPLARYNQGNALLAAGDPAAAADAYRRSLRLDPGNDDAKHNLELALRRLDEQRPPPAGGGQQEQQEQQEQQDSDGEGGEPPAEGEPGEDEPGERGEAPVPGAEPPADADPRSDDPSGGNGDRGSDEPGGETPPPDAGAGEAPRGGAETEPPLPGFREVPDMSAEQAAALLESVDDLERQRRRAEAAQRAQQAGREKDW